MSTFENINVKLRITVDNTHLEPEIGVLSVAYAFVAKKADHANRATVADKLAGDSIYVNQSMNVGIGTLQPKEKLDVNGAIRIGSTETSNPGTIRYTNNDFQGYDGSEWISFSKKNGSVIRGIAGENIQGASCPMPVYMSKDGLIKVQN